MKYLKWKSSKLKRQIWLEFQFVIVLEMKFFILSAALNWKVFPAKPWTKKKKKNMKWVEFNRTFYILEWNVTQIKIQCDLVRRHFIEHFTNETKFYTYFYISIFTNPTKADKIKIMYSRYFVCIRFVFKITLQQAYLCIVRYKFYIYSNNEITLSVLKSIQH